MADPRPDARDRLEQLPLDELAELVDAATAGSSRAACWDLLDTLRRPAVLRRIDAEGSVDVWAGRILGLIDASQLTMATLLRRRAEEYGTKVLFETPGRGGGRSVSWRQTAAWVDALARGLMAIAGGETPRVAIISENRVEMAFADLACQAAGLVSVLIPAQATETDVAFMLRQSEAGVAIAGSREILGTLKRLREGLPKLGRLVAMDTGVAGGGVLALDEITARAGETSLAELERRRLDTRIEALATIMYTSGTTGTPKGICFSHRNIVFKRFARALALPEIGEDDVFLCYLPLYHTFGRFLEMYGCIFWGATYVFLDSPAVEALIGGMRRWRPTVFISVPKKWIQLYEEIARAVDIEAAEKREIDETVRDICGGRLRFGLSAAGRLDAEIFRFFQGHGVELLSGFGMTEATGGITMTPPGRYKDDSLGPALPGIELAVGEDGELSVRGPYVMIGHVATPEDEKTLDADGWFSTGDLVERDADGFIRLVDRKKEIYKNVKGETIAPARIESFFRDFASVGRVFLVGDHREFNTALIWPSPEVQGLDFSTMTDEERRAHFRSIVSSVNVFLAPYERIVDFALLDRDFEADKGELTPKGTPRRKVVESHFAETIRLLYRRAHLKVGGLAIIFPNWLFQALGLTAQDLRLEAERIALPTRGTALTVRRLQDGVALVGSCVYRHPPDEPLQLGILLTTPRLWLANEELVDFAPLDVRLRERPGRAGEALSRQGRPAPGLAGDALKDAVQRALTARDLDLIDLHRAGLLLSRRTRTAGSTRCASSSGWSSRGSGGHRAGSRAPAAGGRLAVPGGEAARVHRAGPRRRDARAGDAAAVSGVARSPVGRRHARALCERTLTDARLQAFVDEAREAGRATEAGRSLDRRATALFKFLAAYGASHPTRYRTLRAFFVRSMLFGGREPIRQESWRSLDELVHGFRQWLGPTARVAVDAESGQEYRWEDVVAFDDAVPGRDRERIVDALRSTPFLREAVFLFSGGATPRLGDIPPGGLWIRPLGERHDKAVYRITVQTRFQGSYDLAVNVNHGRTQDQVREEIRWLVLCGEPGGHDPLVEDFGGYWPQQDLWTEEFIPGESLGRTLKRVARQGDDERFRQLWPFFAWSALAVYVDFWNRVGRRHEIAEPDMTNVIVPTHDYQTGARIVSLAAVREHDNLVAMLRYFHEQLVLPAEQAHPVLAGLVGWDQLFASLLEIVGEDEGARLLREVLHREGDGAPDDFRSSLRSFLVYVETRGFVPMRLYFAVTRYRRWSALSSDPTPQARADAAGVLGHLRPGARRAALPRDPRPVLPRDGLQGLPGPARHGP
jgi:long-subunit acyl-CoA synthetase (AMP-forming)